MRYFKQQVIETRTYTVEYVVEAENAEEAKDKIAIGDTVQETELRQEGVQTRDSWEALVEMPEGWTPYGISENPKERREFAVKAFRLARESRIDNFVNLIDLVKAVRVLAQAGLKDSKEFVDSMRGTVYLVVEGDVSKGEPADYFKLRPKV